MTIFFPEGVVIPESGSKNIPEWKKKELPT